MLTSGGAKLIFLNGILNSLSTARYADIKWCECDGKSFEYTSAKCNMLQGQLDYHFGLDRERIVERCVCLTVLTEYICTAYRSNLLYKTFEVNLSEKYADKLFGKLYVEWFKVFQGDFPAGKDGFPSTWLCVLF